jgi:hypothetical protein
LSHPGRRVHPRQRDGLFQATPPQDNRDGCPENPEQLFDDLDRQLDEPVPVPVLEHLEACATCQGLAAQYRRTIAAPAEVEWRSIPEAVERLAERVRLRLLALLQSDTPRT